MAWPLGRTEEKPPEEKPEEKPPEKTPAELIADSLAPLREKMDAMSAGFDELKNRAVTRPQPTREELEKGQPPRTSFLDDEEKAFNERAAPLAIHQLNTQFELMYDRVSREYIEDMGRDAWKEIEPDIRKSLEDPGVNPVVRANAQYIRNTVDMVIGQKTRKGLKFNSKDKRFFLEDGSHAPESTTPVPKPEDGLSEKQVKAAKAFGMKIDDYKKSLNKLEIVS